MLSYKGYVAKVSYDSEAKLLHGEVLGIADVITFQSKHAETIEQEFHYSVDDYLEFCKKMGKTAQKSVSGETRVRMGAERHLLISKISQAQSMSMNDWLKEAIDEKLQREVQLQ